METKFKIASKRVCSRFFIVSYYVLSHYLFSLAKHCVSILKKWYICLTGQIVNTSQHYKDHCIVHDDSPIFQYTMSR